MFKNFLLISLFMCSTLQSTPYNGVLFINNLCNKNIRVDGKIIFPGKSKLEEVNSTDRIIKLNNTGSSSLEISCEIDNIVGMLFPVVKDNNSSIEWELTSDGRGTYTLQIADDISTIEERNSEQQIKDSAQGIGRVSIKMQSSEN